MRRVLLLALLGHGRCAPADARGTALDQQGGPLSLAPATRLDQQLVPSPAPARASTGPPAKPTGAEVLPKGVEPYQDVDPSLRCPVPAQAEPIMMYSRIIGEHAYLRNWVDWHTRVGVECFFLLGIRMESKEKPLDLGDQVVLFEKETFGKMKYLHFRTYWLMAREAAVGYTWVFISDPDEFLVLAPQFPSIHDFVAHHRDQLGETITTALTEKNAFPAFRAKHP